MMKNRPHHESGEQIEEPTHPEQYSFWHPSSVGFVYSRWLSTVTQGGADRITSHVIFLMRVARLIVCILTVWLKTGQGSMCLCARFIPSSCHPWCVFERYWSSFCPSPVSLRLLLLLFHTLPVLCPAPPRVKTTALTQNEEYCPVAKNNPLTCCEPKLLDDFDHSETSAMIFPG